VPDFFESRKAAAVLKHGILSRYPVIFASKTGKDVENNRVVFLDGYAGRGEYERARVTIGLIFRRPHRLQPLGESQGVAVVAARREPVTSGGWIPGCLSPLNRAVIGHHHLPPL
jgi:hypothetical protein